MKVDSISNSIKTKASPQIPSNQLRNQEVNNSSIAASSTVEITKALLTIKNDLPTEATFNTEKVNRIKAAIEGGLFEVNSKAVADNLIATAHDLLNTQTVKR